MDEKQIQLIMSIYSVSREQAIEIIKNNQANATTDSVYLGKKQVTKTYKDNRPGSKAKPINAQETVDDTKSTGELVTQFLAPTEEGKALREQFDKELAKIGITGLSVDKKQGMWADLVKQSAKQYAAGYEQTPWDLFNLLNEGYSATDQTVQKNNLANLTRDIRRTAIDYGVQLTDKQIISLANRAMKENWDAASLGEFIAKEGKAGDGAGKIGTTIGALRQTAADYGVYYSDDWYRDASKKIFEGTASEDTFVNMMKQDSKSRYVAFADRVDAGLTMRQAVAPYISSYAQILEVPSNSVDLNDPLLTRALTTVDKDGTPTPTSLWQFEYDLRQDPRWRYTKNAEETMMAASRQVLQDFGLVAR